MSPANIPIYQFKTVIIVAGVLLFMQGIAQVMRCIICLRTGAWPPPPRDVEELEKLLVEEAQPRGAAAQRRGGRRGHPRSEIDRGARR